MGSLRTQSEGEDTRRVTPSEGVHYKPSKQPMKKAR